MDLRSPSCSMKYICIDSTGPLLRIRGTVCITAGREGRSVDALTKPSPVSRSFATSDAGVEIALCLLRLLVLACRLTRLIRGKPLWRDKRMRFGIEDPCRWRETASMQVIETYTHQARHALGRQMSDRGTSEPQQRRSWADLASAVRF